MKVTNLPHTNGIKSPIRHCEQSEAIDTSVDRDDGKRNPGEAKKRGREKEGREKRRSEDCEKEREGLY